MISSVNVEVLALFCSPALHAYILKLSTWEGDLSTGTGY